MGGFVGKGCLSRRVCGFTEQRLEVRYSFEADGRKFEGTRIDGNVSLYNFDEARRLASRFVPEAANLATKDLTFMHSIERWQVPFPGARIQVRYDPADPQRSVMIAGGQPVKTIGAGWIWSIGFAFILLAVLLLAVGGANLFRSSKFSGAGGK